MGFAGITGTELGLFEKLGQELQLLGFRYQGLGQRQDSFIEAGTKLGFTNHTLGHAGTSPVKAVQFLTLF